jgi:hypothetical protein
MECDCWADQKSHRVVASKKKKKKKKNKKKKRKKKKKKRDWVRSKVFELEILCAYHWQAPHYSRTSLNRIFSGTIVQLAGLSQDLQANWTNIRSGYKLENEANRKAIRQIYRSI